MADILQMTFSIHFLQYFHILIQISLKFVSKAQLIALVSLMAWCQTSDKPLPRPMMIQTTVAYASLGDDEFENLVLLGNCFAQPTDDKLFPYNFFLYFGS